MTFVQALMMLYPQGISVDDYSSLETELNVVYRLTALGGFTPRTQITQIEKPLMSRLKQERQPRHTPENLLPRLKAALGKRRWKATPVLMAELRTSRKMLNRTLELLKFEPGFETKGNHHKKYRFAA